MLLITNKTKKQVFGFTHTTTYIFVCPNEKCKAQHTLYVITCAEKRCENCGTMLPPAVAIFNNIRTRLRHHGKSDICSIQNEPLVKTSIKNEYSRSLGFRSEKTYDEILQETLRGDVRHVEDCMGGWGIPFDMED